MIVSLYIFMHMYVYGHNVKLKEIFEAALLRIYIARDVIVHAQLL